MKKAFCLLMLFCAIVSYAQETPFHYYSNVGKYNESIKCVAQDKNGRLLLGTQNGLIIYTGYASRKAYISGAVNKEIVSIFVEKNAIYALNAHGVPLKLFNDSLKSYLSVKPKSEVKYLEVKDDVIYFYTKREILKYNEKTKKFISSETYLFAEEPSTSAQYFGRNDLEPYHITSSNELILVKDQEARNIPSNNYTISFGIGIENQIVLAANRTVKGTLVAFSNGQFKRLNYPAKIGNVHVNGVKQIRGRLMIFTDNGCIYFNKGLRKPGLVWFHGVACNDGVVDKNGNLWISTKSKGLILIPRGKHKKLIEEPISFVQLNNGTLYLGNNSASIIQLDKAGNVKQRISNEALTDNISYLCYDSKFNAYFVQSGLLLQDKFVSLGMRVHGQFRKKDGTLYLATSKGLLRYEAGTVQQFVKGIKKPNYGTLLLNEECFLLQSNPSGDNFLCATENGLFMENNGELKEINRNGKSIHVVGATWFKDSWYVITSNNSLYQISNGKVLNVRSLNATGVVNATKILGSGAHLYLLTESGLYRTKGIDVAFESFRDVMGFDGLYIRDFSADNDEIYLATQAGLFTYLWKDVEPQMAQFILGDPFNKNKKETSKLRFTSGSLSLPVECIDLSGNHNYHLQYRLINDGVPGAWVEVMPELQSLALSNLATGKYQLEVRMIDPVSGLSTKIEKRKFEVPQEWWQLKLLWIGVGVALVLSVQWMMKQLRKKQELKPKKKATQTS